MSGEHSGSDGSAALTEEDDPVAFFRGFTGKLEYLRDPSVRQRAIARVVKGTEERDAIEAFLAGAMASEEPAGSIRLAFRVKSLVGAYEKAGRKRYSRQDEEEAGQRSRRDLAAVRVTAHEAFEQTLLEPARQR